MPPAHPSPGHPHGGEPNHHLHLTILLITNTTTTISAHSGHHFPALVGEERAQTMRLKGAAVKGLETPECSWIINDERRTGPKTSQDFTTHEGLLPSPTPRPVARTWASH